MGCLLEKNKSAQFSFIKIPIFELFGQPPLPVTKEGAVSVVLVTHFFSSMQLQASVASRHCTRA